ncbi:hypothetical protein DOTSEDRAFT_43948 [Dothistroma septosporum NZE10]|uniref:Uncharacterized protein n=1 Tax=Dothistroma septosporum (strain NZE10 / CBS 128990) TaxID=675120 RepID=N1PTD3_DOTSN|nr:hypothetical protein DOTSEDRAFT_43948 [Dothistroma septosporum NZE10]
MAWEQSSVTKLMSHGGPGIGNRQTHRRHTMIPEWEACYAAYGSEDHDNENGISGTSIWSRTDDPSRHLRSPPRL